MKVVDYNYKSFRGRPFLIGVCGECGSPIGERIRLRVIEGRDNEPPIAYHGLEATVTQDDPFAIQVELDNGVRTFAWKGGNIDAILSADTLDYLCRPCRARLNFEKVIP